MTPSIRWSVPVKTTWLTLHIYMKHYWQEIGCFLQKFNSYYYFGQIKHCKSHHSWPCRLEVSCRTGHPYCQLNRSIQDEGPPVREQHSYYNCLSQSQVRLQESRRLPCISPTSSSYASTRIRWPNASMTPLRSPNAQIPHTTRSASGPGANLVRARSTQEAQPNATFNPATCKKYLP